MRRIHHIIRCVFALPIIDLLLLLHSPQSKGFCLFGMHTHTHTPHHCELAINRIWRAASHWDVNRCGRRATEWNRVRAGQFARSVVFDPVPFDAASILNNESMYVYIVHAPDQAHVQLEYVIYIVFCVHKCSFFGLWRVGPQMWWANSLIISHSILNKYIHICICTHDMKTARSKVHSAVGSSEEN